MIAQQFDLFGHGDAPTTSRKPARGTVNTGQGALFAPDAYDLVDTKRRPAEAPDLRADLHTDELPTPTAAADRPEVIDVADLTDADVAALAAGATVVDDAYLAARLADLDATDPADDITDAHPDVVRAAIGHTRYAAAKHAALATADDVPAAIAATLTPAARRLIRAAVDGTPELADLDAVYAFLGADRWNAIVGDALMPSTPDHARAAVYRAALLAYSDPITGQDIVEILASTTAAAAEPQPTPTARPVDPDALVATTRRVPSSSGHREFRYIGAVRRGGAVLAECGHEHPNRDQSTGTGGRAAVACARDIIAGAARPATADHVARCWRDRWQALTHSSGHTFTAATIAAARTQSETDAQAYLDAVAAVRAADL